MAKPCIICGSTAGSHEHVFPAALGGRRTSKQIYCAPHNQVFGQHVAILGEQFSILNASLEVRHDRRESQRSFEIAVAERPLCCSERACRHQHVKVGSGDHSPADAVRRAAVVR
ncbi:HNH endonuclease [Paraburkholderia nemoris]|uniref:HNH endonuclease n=1 Tax=Paraburkholderia nemoris TaxID=2793076 RepID=UPI0038BB18AE